MPRRIKKAKISFISLVPKGANKLPVIYKEDGHYEFNTLIKQSPDFEERGELTAVVYAPENVDSQGDIASAEVIKEMAYSFSKSGEGVDIKHDNKTLSKEKAFVAETFIIQKGDDRFSDMEDYSGNKVDVSDGWAVVIKIEDSELRTLFKDGEWNGVSMAGRAEVEEEKQESVTQVLKDIFRSILPGTRKEEIDMDKKELQEVLGESNKSLAEEIVKALKPQEEKAPDVDLADPVSVQKHLDSMKKTEEKDNTPIFKGDLTKEEDVKKHALALKIHALQKATDMSDPDAIMKLHESIKKLQEDFKVEKSEDEDEESETLSKDEQLSKMREKLMRMSRKIDSKSSKDPIDDILKLEDGFTKKEREAFDAAEDIVKAAAAR
jgi:hypothetical protein|tara:strand:+ start:15328 stop:16464 length:1137 start_codon:yes stop_codon:yes gene_type:complete